MISFFLTNFRPSATNFKSFSRSLETFFLTACQNNFGNKIPIVSSIMEFKAEMICSHFFQLLSQSNAWPFKTSAVVISCIKDTICVIYSLTIISLVIFFQHGGRNQIKLHHYFSFFASTKYFFNITILKYNILEIKTFGLGSRIGDMNDIGLKNHKFLP